MKWLVRWKRSFAWMAAIWVLLTALLAFGGLLVLRRLHRQAAVTTAAELVVERGQLMAMNLAMQAAEMEDESAGEQWKAFARLVHSLREVEDDLEFVTVRRNGVTLFQEHVDGSTDLRSQMKNLNDWDFSGPVNIRQQMISIRGERIPVVMFEAMITNAATTHFEVDVGMRRMAVQREEWPVSSAINSMFRLSVFTVFGCFAVVLALMIWTARREEKRERQRNQEEHLTFSGVLANGIVHDFRNPMSSLKLDVQMLGREVDKGNDINLERVSHLARHVNTTLDRMEKVLHEFLYLARPASSSSAEVVDLRKCLQECVELLAPRFGAAGVRIQWDSSMNSAERFPILAHPASLKRALVNILMNAEQFSEKGMPIALRVERNEKNVCASIRDSGPGIPKSKRAQVFDMFYSTRPQGTGLGLFLAKSAIEQNGGHIRLMEVEKGTCFQIEFPMADLVPLEL